mmetsp:Transcript_5446/g.14221  ORF Transcript_5446/g.14221 Transcript_5446/m.14221 type:complete len:218 (+) Transcript_5446:223-876(+)
MLVLKKLNAHSRGSSLSISSFATPSSRSFFRSLRSVAFLNIDAIFVSSLAFSNFSTSNLRFVAESFAFFFLCAGEGVVSTTSARPKGGGSKGFRFFTHLLSSAAGIPPHGPSGATTAGASGGAMEATTAGVSGCAVEATMGGPLEGELGASREDEEATDFASAGGTFAGAAGAAAGPAAGKVVLKAHTTLLAGGRVVVETGGFAAAVGWRAERAVFV